MLRTLAISLITLFSPVLYSCEKTPELTAATDNPLTVDSAGKTLIAYYSFSGDCRSIVASMTSQMDAWTEICPFFPTFWRGVPSNR